MSPTVFSVISGSSFAVLTLLLMIPMKWKSDREKLEAILGAMIERFSIGFVVGIVQIVSIAPLNGFIIGIVMSLPSAIVTRAYLPILLVGGIGATLIGFMRSLVSI